MIRLIYITLLLLVVSCSVHTQTTEIEQKSKLPRKYGPIKLGMSVADFQKISELNPSQCDHNCVEGELSESFTTDRAYFPESMGMEVRYYPNAHIKYQPRPQAPRLVFVYFYQGKLYRIVMNGVFTILPQFKERYIKNLGRPNYEDKEGNEYNMASFGWEDEKTKLSVVHTAGKVWIDSVQIQYIDKDTLGLMPKEEEYE